VKFTSVTRESQLPALQRLRSGELGKHKALLASITRMAARGGLPGNEYERALAIPYRLLADVEAQAPHLVAGLLATPQFGAWADTCVRRLLDGTADSADNVPLATDLGHLALFAATAATRARHPFALEVPLRGGTACFPAAGTATPGASTPWEWGRAWLNGTDISANAGTGDSGCHVGSSVSTVDVSFVPGSPGWSGLPRFRAAESGLGLDVVLDDRDPFLDRFGGTRVRVADEDVPTWRDLLALAWRLLAREHYPLAELIAGTVRTVVPLARPGPTRSAGATEIATFGAVAMSLPADALSMAEALVHEAHHAILGAAMDAEPLVRDDEDAAAFLAYAPWRDDPRPGTALLQGIFAHYGMGRFWRQRYRAGPPAQRERAAAEFGRLRAMTERTALSLAGSGVLTEAGADFLAGLQAELASWHDEDIPPFVADHVADLTADHEARWRLSHLKPDPEGVRTLADAWQGGSPPPVPLDAVTARLVPGPLPVASANTRAYLLALRYRRPEVLRGWLAGGEVINPADAALVRGDHDAAAAGYLARITADARAPDRTALDSTTLDIDAWAGLATVRRRSGPIAHVYAQHPELLMAVWRHLPGQARPQPDDLARWLAGIQ
jgi:HEXXH motif-containing protein